MKIHTYSNLIRIFALIIVLSYPVPSSAEMMKFNVTRDVWLSAYPGEENNNMGASKKLKLKGIQEMALLDFDLSVLNGKKVESARIYFRNAAKNNKLRKIGLSTVASPWTEGKSRGYFVDFLGHGATFKYSSYKKSRWAGDGSDLTDVSMGNGNTWQHHTILKKEDRQWWSVDVAVELIQALITGRSHGLLVMDESGQTFVNNYVYSSESRYSPYIVIDVTATKKQKPLTPALELYSSLKSAHLEYGAAILRVPVEDNMFAFKLSVNNEEVPLWRTPRPGSVNAVQEILLDWLSPGQEIKVAMRTVDVLGQVSAPAVVSGHASSSLPRISFPKSAADYTPANGYKEEKQHYDYTQFRVWAAPDITKIAPMSGNVINEKSEGVFNKKNPLWSGDEKEINLSGVKGEVVAFQLCVEKGRYFFSDTEFTFSSLTGTSGNGISLDNITLSQVHYIKINEDWYPELAVPVSDGKMTGNASSVDISKQKNQLMYIDLYIPAGTPHGLYHGDIKISNKGAEETLRINLRVADITMPERLSFVPELNMYKGPDNAGSEKFYQAHRIAHEHRTLINRVPYSQDGRVHEDMIPKISYSEDGELHIDWMEYDKRLGPLFNGSAFMKKQRKGIPVERFYLPFYENWPNELASNYDYETNESAEKNTHHALKAPILEQAFSLKYTEGFRMVVKEFKNHFEEKGWDQTEFQFYLNNKKHWPGASSWWDLDEPMSYDDWTAIKFYGSLFRQGRGAMPSQFIFRADISRPRWQHDWLNGVLERMYVQSNAFFRYPERVRQMKQNGPMKVSVYGSLNDIHSSNHQTVLWCMAAFAEGADGVLPWQSLGGPQAFTVPDRNALIVAAPKETRVDWAVSLRVKALRRCQQDVELLAILENKKGFTREQIRDFVFKYFEIVKKSPGSDDSNSGVIQGKINSYTLENFRRIIIDMLGAT